MSVAQEIEFLLREERGKEVERNTIPDELNGASIHVFDIDQREILVPVSWRAYFTGDSVSALESVHLYLLDGNIYIVRGVQVIVIRRTEESIAVRHNFKHSGSFHRALVNYLRTIVLFLSGLILEGIGVLLAILLILKGLCLFLHLILNLLKYLLEIAAARLVLFLVPLLVLLLSLNILRRSLSLVFRIFRSIFRLHDFCRFRCRNFLLHFILCRFRLGFLLCLRFFLALGFLWSFNIFRLRLAAPFRFLSLIRFCRSSLSNRCSLLLDRLFLDRFFLYCYCLLRGFLLHILLCLTLFGSL